MLNDVLHLASAALGKPSRPRKPSSLIANCIIDVFASSSTSREPDHSSLRDYQSCTLCDQYFVHGKALENHYQQCYAERSMQYAKNLEANRQLTAQESNVDCGSAERTSSTYGQTDAQIRAVQPCEEPYCETCDRYFSSEGALCRHCEDTHPEELPLTLCPICSEPCILSDHLTQAARHRALQTSPQHSGMGDIWPRPCLECGGTFSLENMQKHRRQISKHNRIMHAWQAEHSADEWQRFCWPCDKYFSSEPELTHHQTECTSPLKYMTRIEGDYFNALLLEQARPERSLATGIGEAHGDADSNDISAGAAEDPFASPPFQSLHLHDEDLGSETVDMQPSDSEIIHSVPDAGLRQSEAPQRIQRVDALPRRSSCGAPPSRTLPVFPPVPSDPPQSIRLDANVIPQNHRRHSTAGNEAMAPRALPHSPLRSPSVSMWDASTSCSQQSERIMRDTGSPTEEEAPPPYTFTVIQDVLPLRPSPNSPGSTVSVEEQPRPPANDSRSLAIDSSRRARGDSLLVSVSTPTPSAYECPLCFECEDDLSNVPCGHVFCTPCISNHLEANVYCPLCRAPAERKDTRKVFLNT